MVTRLEMIPNQDIRIENGTRPDPCPDSELQRGCIVTVTVAHHTPGVDLGIRAYFGSGFPGKRSGGTVPQRLSL